MEKPGKLWKPLENYEIWKTKKVDGKPRKTMKKPVKSWKTMTMENP